MYKRLAEVRTDEDVDLLREEMQDRYGQAARAGRRSAAGGAVPGPGPPSRSLGGHDRREVRAVRPRRTPESRVLRLGRIHPGSLVKAPVQTILVPRPQTAVVGGHPITGMPLLEWARSVIDAIIDPTEGGTPR